MKWSQLTILLASNAALCSREGQEGISFDGSLPRLWRKARRTMRAEHGPAPNKPASGPALSWFGKVNGAETFRRLLVRREPSRNGSGFRELTRQLRCFLPE